MSVFNFPSVVQARENELRCLSLLELLSQSHYDLFVCGYTQSKYTDLHRLSGSSKVSLFALVSVLQAADSSNKLNMSSEIMTV